MFIPSVAHIFVVPGVLALHQHLSSRRKDVGSLCELVGMAVKSCTWWSWRFFPTMEKILLFWHSKFVYCSLNCRLLSHQPGVTELYGRCFVCKHLSPKFLWIFFGRAPQWISVFHLGLWDNMQPNYLNHMTCFGASMKKLDFKTVE